MEIKKEYYQEHQRLRKYMGQECSDETDRISQDEIKGFCAQMLVQYQVQEYNPDPERVRTFRQIARDAMAMAQELLLNLSIYTERDCIGCIELTAPALILDASCSPSARQTLSQLFSEADQIWIDGGKGMCRMRMVFRLYEEEAE